MVDLKALIQKQREALQTHVVGDLDVALGGAKVTVTFEKLPAEEWDDLVAKNPPRPGVEGDAMLGYCASGLSAAYPRVKVDGDDVDADTWVEMFQVLDALYRNAVSTSLWGLNILSSIEEMKTLGKASPGGK